MGYGSAERGYGAYASVIHIDLSHPERIAVPEAELIFAGHYSRTGPDLVLTGVDGRHHIIPGYFSSGHRSALVAPNGASLSPDLVDLLAGSVAPGQYAQAQPTTPPDPAGKVEKVEGSATVIRNGVSIALNPGDAVYKSDVIQTGAHSSVGISFPDGTALNLVANTRMALNDYSYDPNSTSNVALISLVEGTFSFVAGKVAHSGAMKIDTPVATMGIRGTTGWVQEQVGTITSNVGNVTYSFAVATDFGTNTNGLYDLIDQNGNVIATVSQTGFVTMVTPQGIGLPPTVTTQPQTAAQLAFEQQIIEQVFQTLNPGNPNPQPIPGSPGSSTPQPSPGNPLPQLIDNGGSPFATNGAGGGNSAPTTATITLDGASGPTQIVYWARTGNGNWNNALNWSDDIVPLSWETVEIIFPYQVTIDSDAVAMSLVVSADAVLRIVNGGSLTISNAIDNIGTIELNSSGADPTLALRGSVILSGGGTVELMSPSAAIIAAIAGAKLTDVDNLIVGTGTIGQGDGALSLVTGTNGIIGAVGTIEAANGTLLLDTGNTILNSGVLEAAAGGTLQIDDNVTNYGLVAALSGGTVILAGVTVFGVHCRSPPPARSRSQSARTARLSRSMMSG